MSGKNWTIPMGVPKPEKEPASINEMRQLIQNAARDSSIIHRSLSIALHQGLSGEDTYVHLDYHSLRLLEEYWQTVLRFEACRVDRGTFIIKDPSGGTPL